MDSAIESYYATIARSQRYSEQLSSRGSVSSAVGDAIIEAQQDGSSRYDKGVYLLCAEPGMGKTTALAYIRNSLEPRHDKVHYLELSGCPEERVSRKVARACEDVRRYRKRGNKVAVLVDDLPATDESVSRKVAHDLQRLSDDGYLVVVSFAPEAAGICEEFRNPTVFRSSDFLLVQKTDLASCFGPQGVSREYTHDIPALVRPLLLAAEPTSDMISADPYFLTAISRVVQQSLRSTLLQEERELRLIMMELGTGDLDDLIRVIGDVDEALVQDIAQEAPFFGIGLDERTFSCAGLHDLNCLRGLRLGRYFDMGVYNDLTVEVASLLLERGQYERAGVLLSSCKQSVGISLTLRNAVGLMDAGYCALVERALKKAEGVLSTEDETLRDARLAVSCVRDSGCDYAQLISSLPEGPRDEPTRLLLAFRALLSGDIPSAETMLLRQRHGEGYVQRGLATALTGLDLLRQLRFAEAYAYLTGQPDRLERRGTISAVLWAEYVVAGCMCGNYPTPTELEQLDEVVALASCSHIACVRWALSAVWPVMSMLTGHGGSNELVEVCIQRASLMGARWLQAACLTAAALADQRAGVATRAYVRLVQAYTLSRQTDDPYLQASSHLLCCAAKGALGEDVSADAVLEVEMPGQMLPVARALAAVIDSDGAARLELLDDFLMTPCPGGMQLMVDSLSHDFGGVSERFRNAAPRAWVDEANHTIGLSLGRGTIRQPPAMDAEPAEVAPYKLEISLLGGLHVRVNGVPISETRFERRRAKSLLVLLAATRGHACKRYEIMETVWPECDCQDARQRIYEATSVLRGELTARLGKDEANPLVSNRGAGTLGLDDACTRCDVDEFEELARLVLSRSSHPAGDLPHELERVESLYRGDLFVPVSDGAGLIERRGQELKDLFVDVMVFASGWALAVGRPTAAVHYAQRAALSDALREDAEIALLRALGASGRRAEAEVSYMEFSKRIVGSVHRPPSREVRDTYRLVADGSERAVGRGSHVPPKSPEDETPEANT